MLTPQEVANKSFTKSMMGGYSMPMVDEFLDELTEDYSALYKENAALKAKLKVLVEKVEEYRSTEDSMRAALFSAQKMAASIVEEAQAKSSSIVATAEAGAKVEIAKIRENVAAEQARLDAAKAETAGFVSQWQTICDKQAAFLKALPELPLPVKQPETAPQEGAAVPVSAPQEGAIEESIFNAIREEQSRQSAGDPSEEPAEEPAEAASPSPAEPAAEQEHVPTAEEVADLFETRTFRLDELQFGRNYSGDNKK